MLFVLSYHVDFEMELFTE